MNSVKRSDELQGDIIHEYDGIEEADNDLPRWWLMIFFGTILFSVGYWFVYEEFGMAPSPADSYVAALLEAAESGGEVSDDLLLALVSDPEAVARGEALYGQHCVSCHKEQGAGDIGPNLTDRYWLHGGGPADIYTTIYDGVPDKGMTQWGPVLGSGGVQRVTAYVMTLRNREVPGKEPQGELWQPDVDAAP